MLNLPIWFMLNLLPYLSNTYLIYAIPIVLPNPQLLDVLMYAKHTMLFNHHEFDLC